MGYNLVIFLSSAVMISLSGVLLPGPMTAAVIQQGSRSKLTGVYLALGHGVIEMPLIFFIFLGAGSLLQLVWVRILIGLAGGIYLIFMGKGLLGKKEYEGNPVRASVLGGETRVISNREGFPAVKKGYVPVSFYSGIFLSIGNPSFLLWWATIGAGLIISALRFGLIGLILFALFHWLCDLLWYSFLSLASFRGVKMFGAGLYRKVSIFCGSLMFFFGGVFIFNSLKLLI
jgi:threonine/homoserine/homoserine lactone efflux protein